MRQFERKSKRRPSPVTYCVVVEGEKTEANYFHDIKAEFDKLQRRNRILAQNNGVIDTKDCSLVVKVAGGMSFHHVVSVAIEQVQTGHSKVWCVVDADFYVRLTGLEKKRADEIFEKALGVGIDLIFSRPCFEVWFIQHFSNSTRALQTGQRAKLEISKLWPDYVKKPTDHWNLLRDRVSLVAIPNATAVRKSHRCPPNLVYDCDASSEVDWLIMTLFFGINVNDKTSEDPSMLG